MKIYQEQLPQHLNHNFVPIYLVSGDEPLLVQESCDMIRRHAKAQDFNNRVVLHIERGFNWQEFVAAYSNMSLFADKNLLELRMPSAKPGDKGSKILQAYSQNPSLDSLLLIITGKLDTATQKNKWFKAIEKVGIFIPVWPPKPDKLPTWIRQRLQQAGFNASADGIKLLSEYVEGNLLAAAQEIEKLRLLYDNDNLSTEQIAAAIVDNARFNIFVLVDSAISKNHKKTIRILQGLKNEKIEPILILWAITRELRRQHTQKTEKLLQYCARLDRIIKGATKGNIWLELEKLCLKL